MSPNPPIRSISFIGLGLIGVSLLRAFRNAPIIADKQIVLQGFDPSLGKSDLPCLKNLGLDRFVTDKAELYQADLLILSAPVEINIMLLDEIKRFTTPETLITDVSSTKALIAKKAQELSLPFIGMHPMAGKEQQGYRESHEELLKGRPMIMCDDKGLLDTEKGIFLTQLLKSAGCITIAMTPEEHDQIIAKISHLPQLLSTLLMTHCAGAIDKSGPGFATLARLAGSPWKIWRDIVATNSSNIAEELEQFSKEIAELAHEVKALNMKKIEQRFTDANQLYKTLKEINRE
ncbi:prephenate dehydrogenase [Chlorobium phaeobacteroides]|jgi:prephenate dehydrogenase|uniref:Prephenate dehydrogenase n=1 Tax=Chlorobium phaeobacteroides (strain DSM 266 / SMG 266 / 2430) TaxID=290317 RepID=A1BJI3_CHLPD|nr:prephenate dehydrogenase/arogenate dehydrogenase family protein [Chlorobium phaeobacteroides]ABL66560.1 prephenate dehydrogenase [Chlorobium phaeobacteroides DSM 266]MBV5319693.1 prephenate dehydrogenase/arogenate dehydrogenase family protein [Chlorobium phaeobacteroides]